MTDIRIETQRLIIRSAIADDAAIVNGAIHASAGPLQSWMPWANPLPTLEGSIVRFRGVVERAHQDVEYQLLLFTRDGAFVGSTGLHDLNWRVPCVEIGYWVDQRQVNNGYITEAVGAITTFARNTMGMRRVEIRMSDRNERSWRVPERLGYTLEAVLRNHRVNNDGRVDHTRIYVSLNDTPTPAAPWAELHRKALSAAT